jgi:hypothetical protein|tara:strand:- start:151 stop:456 length:306 start_codon:yes stop_codon:yes gene_type:complete
MTNLKNQNAGGKLKQSNVQKFARGGASMYDPYSYMTQGHGEPKPPPSAMGTGGRTRPVMGRDGTISLKASRAKALARSKRVSKGKIRNLPLVGFAPPSRIY